ncbi:MAG: hypothetical protein ACI841_004863 [Planctomycetota bacterium]
MLEILLMHARVGIVHPLHSQTQCEESLFQALISAAGTCERAAGSGNSGKMDSACLRIHARDGHPVVIGVQYEGDTERLLNRDYSVEGGERLGAVDIHVSSPHLFGLFAKLPHIQLASDINTFEWNPKVSRLAWTPSLAWDITKIGGWLARMSAFQLTKANMPAPKRAPQTDVGDAPLAMIDAPSVAPATKGQQKEAQQLQPDEKQPV